MKFLNRLFVAFQLFWMAFKLPVVFTEANFKMLTDLYVMLFNVAEKHQPMMSHVGFVNMDTGEEEELLSVWVGIGANAAPLNRVKELLEENNQLKELLKALKP